jgi:hypothetical protein
MSGLGDRVWAEARAKKERRARAAVFAATLAGVERVVFELVEGVTPGAEATAGAVLTVLRSARAGKAVNDPVFWPSRIFCRIYGLLDASLRRPTSDGHRALAHFRRQPKGWAP